MNLKPHNILNHHHHRDGTISTATRKRKRLSITPGSMNHFNGSFIDNASVVVVTRSEESGRLELESWWETWKG
ncbi:hypothetical protein V6N13_013419 [Hibiscus sabdariffa]|uniref:Uncharacterized protein n=1 Tax=Hibiscus sabdariffa TaxID=183260 RepID=A0ABR2BV48_9ROSI